MPTWVLAVLALAFLAALTGVALAYTHHNPTEQENSWPASDATSTSAPEK